MLTEDQKLVAHTDMLAAQLTRTYGATTFNGQDGLDFEDDVLQRHVNGALRAAGLGPASDLETSDLLTHVFLGVYYFASAAQQGAPQHILDRLRQEEGFSAAIDLPGILGENGHAIQAGIVGYLKHLMPKDKFPTEALNRALALETVPAELPDTYTGEGENARRDLENTRLGAIAVSRRSADADQIMQRTELAARAHIGLTGTALYEAMRGDAPFNTEKAALVTLAYGTSLASARYCNLTKEQRPDSALKRFADDRAAREAPKMAAAFSEAERKTLLDVITERAAAASEIVGETKLDELRGFVARSVGLDDEGNGPEPKKPVPTQPTRPDEGAKSKKRRDARRARKRSR